MYPIAPTAKTTKENYGIDEHFFEDEENNVVEEEEYEDDDDAKIVRKLQVTFTDGVSGEKEE